MRLRQLCSAWKAWRQFRQSRYAAYFLLGMWFEEQKPGFSWKLFGAAVILTVAALLLYRTPAQELCRLCISALPGISGLCDQRGVF